MWYDSGIFLKSTYDNTRYATSIFSSGGHTIQAIILDELSYPTCFDLTINVTDEILQQYSNQSAANFTNFLESTYNDLLDTFTIGDDNSFDNETTEVNITAETLTQVSILTEVVYDVAESYIEDSDNDNEEIIESGFIELQSTLIDNLVETIDDVYSSSGDGDGSDDTTSLTTSVASVLASVTEPFIDDEVVTRENFDTYNGIFDSDTATSVLETIDGSILSSYDNTNTSLDQDIGQNIFETLDNLLTIRKFSNESGNVATDNGQSMVDITYNVSNLVLVNAIPGETYHFETDRLNTQVTKISLSNFDSVENICGDQVTDTLILSHEFVEISSNNGSDLLDCTVMSINGSQDIYSNLNQTLFYASTNYFQSNFFMVKVATGTVFFRT